jgi:hypothetical protein
MNFWNPPFILNIVSKATYNVINTALEKIKGKPEQKFLVVLEQSLELASMSKKKAED